MSSCRHHAERSPQVPVSFNPHCLSTHFTGVPRPPGREFGQVALLPTVTQPIAVKTESSPVSAALRPVPPPPWPEASTCPPHHGALCSCRYPDGVGALRGSEGTHRHSPPPNARESPRKCEGSWTPCSETDQQPPRSPWISGEECLSL